MKNLTPSTVQCPKCKGGILFDTTSKLAMALGHKEVRCDKCGFRYIFVIGRFA
jgi:DNA-directed RNA polymerase subunit RPC12/RpoP